MSLGTCALKVSRVPDAIVAKKYPWQPWNALKISENNLTWKDTYPGHQMQKRERGEGARIRNDSQ